MRVNIITCSISPTWKQVRESCCQVLFSAVTLSCLHMSVIIDTSRKPKVEFWFEPRVIWIWVISWTVGRGPFALGMCRWIPPWWFERIMNPWYLNVTSDYSPPLSVSSIPMTISACAVASSFCLHTHAVTFILKKKAIAKVTVDDTVCFFSFNFDFTF